MLRGLKGEIARRERQLARLKAEYAKGADVLRGRVKALVKRARRRPKRRARQINWKTVFSSLPGRFSMKTLSRHPVAGKRPKPHLYTIISRWKKEGVLTTDSAGGYRKAGASPKRKRRRRPKVARAPRRVARPAPRPETPGA
jgi:hypothetical protein